MEIQAIRNATLKLSIDGHVILVDPYFASKHSLPSYSGRSANPLVDLPIPVETIVEGVELVIISHLHTDHFDDVAKQRIPKHLQIVCQPGDEAAIRASGFTDVSPLRDRLTWNGIVLTRRAGSHGLGPVVDKMGNVMGVLIEAANEPTLYWAGDTVLYPSVADTIAEDRPDIIVTHSCGALWDGDLIVMDAVQTVEVCRLAPSATIVATHMEALDHATTSRDDLRLAAERAQIAGDRLRIPGDGETLIF